MSLALSAFTRSVDTATPQAVIEALNGLKHSEFVLLPRLVVFVVEHDQIANVDSVGM
jgi:hypothetical protein